MEGGWHTLADRHIRSRGAAPFPLGEGACGRLVDLHSQLKSHSFAFSGCPLRLNLNQALLPGCPVSKAAPCPVFRPRNQTTSYRVPMKVLQLLHSFLFRPDVEVVVRALPEPRQRVGMNEFARNILLQHLYRDRECAALGFANEQMNVLGHDYVPGDEHPVPSANALQNLLECRTGARRAE